MRATLRFIFLPALLATVSGMESAAGSAESQPQSGTADLADAEIWYQQAHTLSTQEDAEAKLQEIVSLVQKAADAGHPQAMAQMGVYHRNGDVVPQDWKKAISYYEQAAAAGIAGAMNNLAAMYYLGEGAPRDVGKAQQLCRKAIAIDPSDALPYRNLALYLQDEEPTADIKREICELLHKAAELNDVDAMLILAQEYSEDGGVCDASPKMAYRYWYRAAKRNATQAYYPLAECYLKGSGTETDTHEGLDIMQTAANAGDSRAMAYLADIKLREKRGKNSQKEAYALYRQAAAGGNARALYMLGRAHEEGRLAPPDPEKAAAYYARAIEAGDAHAGAALIRMQMMGFEKAEIPAEIKLQLLAKAAEAGVYGCATHLACSYYAKNEKDSILFRKWLKWACYKDHEPMACFIYGSWLLKETTASEKQQKEAIRLLKFASEQGIGGASCVLGGFYMQENGPVPQNISIAIEYLRLAARQGEADGAELIADMCAEGIGVEKDWWLARKWRRYARAIRKQEENKPQPPLIRLDES